MSLFPILSELFNKALDQVNIQYCILTHGQLVATVFGGAEVCETIALNDTMMHLIHDNVSCQREVKVLATVSAACTVTNSVKPFCRLNVYHAFSYC